MSTRSQMMDKAVTATKALRTSSVWALELVDYIDVILSHVEIWGIRIMVGESHSIGTVLKSVHNILRNRGRRKDWHRLLIIRTYSIGCVQF